MASVNENYLKLQGSYLFSTIAKKVKEYETAHPDANIIRLGIGDVTKPLAPAIIDALHNAVDEMATASTFRGYAPDLGYEFLREKIAKNDYEARGIDISPDEIFVSDGAKSDTSNIQEIFGYDNRVAVCDPVYPVYVDSNVMAGRAGEFDSALGRYKKLIYMPCTKENDFVPEFPKEPVDLIYLCFPNNPTGMTITKERLQDFVDELSNWYVRRSRERFWAKGMEQDKINAYMTLYTALVTVAKVAAPMIPFMSEDIYRNLVCTSDANAPESVHLCDFPVADESLIDPELEQNMEALLDIVVMGRACRNTANIKNRQPIGKMFVKADFTLPEFYTEIIADELNVKKVEFTSDVRSTQKQRS